MRALLVLVALLVASQAHAQTCEVNCATQAGAAFVVLAETVPEAVSYALFVDAKPSSAASSLAGGVITYAFPAGLSGVGSHVVYLEGYSAGLKVVATWSNTVTVTAPPPSWVCSVPSQVTSYSNGDKKITARCPKAATVTKGDRVTVTK